MIVSSSSRPRTKPRSREQPIREVHHFSSSSLSTADTRVSTSTSNASIIHTTAENKNTSSSSSIPSYDNYSNRLEEKENNSYDDDDLKEYDLEHYDDDDANDERGVVWRVDVAERFGDRGGGRGIINVPANVRTMRDPPHLGTLIRMGWCLVARGGGVYDCLCGPAIAVFSEQVYLNLHRWT